MGPPGRKRKRLPGRVRRATKSENEIREENRRLRPHVVRLFFLLCLLFCIHYY